MFEREVTISSIKKQSETLRKLVEELEDKAKFDSRDSIYCLETLKSIETALRKIRRMNEDAMDFANNYSYRSNVVTRIW